MLKESIFPKTQDDLKSKQMNFVIYYYFHIKRVAGMYSYPSFLAIESHSVKVKTQRWELMGGDTWLSELSTRTVRLVTEICHLAGWPGQGAKGTHLLGSPRNA